MAKILVVDDEITMIQIVSELLRADGHDVSCASNIEPACALLEAQKPELLITDLYLEKARPVGLTLLAKATALHPPPVVIVITGFATVETAVDAMRKGAFDYLQKPFKLDEFKLSIQRALNYKDRKSVV